MDIDVTANCSGCSLLKMELDKKTKDMEQIGQSHVTAFLTLKQKILSTETLIRDYQAAKLECELQSKKTEELTRTIHCLRQDLSSRTEEYSKMLTSFEPMKEENLKYVMEVKKLETELHKWKSDAGGAQSLIDQLTERVKQLEKFEKEKDVFTAMTKEHGKIKEKLETLNSQCKEAKERHNEAKKELKQSQKAYQKLLKSALLWGRLADSRGLFNSAQKRAFASLAAENPDTVKLLPALEFFVDDPSPASSHAEQIREAPNVHDGVGDESKQQKDQAISNNDIFKMPQVPDLDIKAMGKLGRGTSSSDFQKSPANFKVPAERLQSTESLFDSPSLPDLEAVNDGGMPELHGDDPRGKLESPAKHSEHTFPTVYNKILAESFDVDNELEEILQIVKRSLPSNLTALSPLPSPEMEKKPFLEDGVISPVRDVPPEIKPVVSEVKSRFPSLPRCAFNWTAKKLPISDKLNEKFGVSLHAGRKIRIRYRCVGSILGSERSRESVCKTYQGVVNFAEAEKPPPAVHEPFFVVDEPDKESVTAENHGHSGSHAGDPSFAARPKLLDPFNTQLRQERPTEAVTVSMSHPRTIPPSLPADLSRKAAETDGKMNSFLAMERAEFRVARTPAPISIKPPQHHILAARTSVKKKQSTINNLFGDSDDEMHGDLETRASCLPSSGEGELEDRSAVLKGAAARPSRNIGGLQPNRPIKSVAIRPVSFKLTKAPVQQLSEWEGLMKNKTVSRMVAPVKRPLEAKSEVAAEPSEMPVVSEIAPASTKKRIAHATKRELTVLDSLPLSPVEKRSKFEDSPSSMTRSSQPETTESLDTLTAVRPATESGSGISATLIPEDINKAETTEASVMGKLEEIHKTETCELKGSRQDQSESTEALVETMEQEPPADETRNLKAVEVNEENLPQGQPNANSPPHSPPLGSLNNETESILDEVEAHKPPSGHCVFDQCPPSPPVVNPIALVTPVEGNEQEPLLEQFTSEDTPQSPIADDTRELSDMESIENCPQAGNSKVVRAIPTSPVKQSTCFQSAPSASAYEIVMQLPNQKVPVTQKPSKKVKKDVHMFVNRFVKGDEESFSTLLLGAVEKLTRPGIAGNPSTLIRHLISVISKDCSSPLDTTFTPPAPSLTNMQQRCIVLLRVADQKYRESSSKETSHIGDYFTDLFLNEISAVLFKRNATFSLEEKSSLGRVYTAICRLRGHLNRARTFLYDCLYFYPSEAYALTYTVLSVWAEVLRHVTYPTGVSAMDQSVVYLLTRCNKVRAVPGLPGKVLQVRSFIQNTYGYKTLEAESNETVNELLVHLVKKLQGTRSVDECKSLSWNLALLARWEGNDWGLMVIKVHLWPLLQRWSLGEGFDASAAGAICCIGLIGRRLLDKQRQEIKGILEVLKSLLVQSDDVSPLIQEAAIETMLLLGPDMVVPITKEWKPRAPLTAHLSQVLGAFIHQRAKPSINNEQDCEPSHCVNSFVDK